MSRLDFVRNSARHLPSLIPLDSDVLIFWRELGGIDDFNAQRPRLGLRNIRPLHVSDHVFEFDCFTWTSFLRRAEIGFRRFGDFELTAIRGTSRQRCREVRSIGHRGKLSNSLAHAANPSRLSPRPCLFRGSSWLVLRQVSCVRETVFADEGKHFIVGFVVAASRRFFNAALTLSPSIPGYRAAFCSFFKPAFVAVCDPRSSIPDFTAFGWRQDKKVFGRVAQCFGVFYS
jgi:hypothetical protein